jgi:TetR/AcrR family transcriptional repressor of mexJK operon
MSRPSPSRPASKTASPGRPKDLAKRAAILEAAKRLFVQQGLERVSMDQIAAEAGVSKLTVYSHFGDKERLFAEAIRAHCEQNMPTRLFDPAPGTPLRAQLTAIGEAFFAMVMSPDAIAGHRILCSPQLAGTALARLAWQAGPARTQAAFAELLRHHIAAGALDIADPVRAAGHFFALLKGDLHTQALLGCQDAACQQAARAHVDSVVDLFLRAYGVPGHGRH